MSFSRRAAIAVVVLIAILICRVPLRIFASQRGYDMWFAGRVIAVDVHRARIRIIRGPTETAEPAIIECEMPRRALRKLHVGMDISAEADTRHIPWRIVHLRPYETFHHRGLPVS